jgi:polyisoprenoid-binding protein YceI
MKKGILALALLMGHSPFVAAAPSWAIIPEQSSVTFTATQNNAPIKGKFTQFKGDIQFDPSQTKDSKIQFEVDTNSINMPLKEITDALKTPDWLSTTAFPKATFETVEINKIDDKRFSANGNLSIRDRTFPITIHFTVDEFTTDKAQVKGNTTVKRIRYGVGQGEWANTDDIKNDVIVDFILQLRPKNKE